MVKFLTNRQKNQLADLLAPIVGRPLSVELTDAASEPGTDLDHPTTADQTQALAMPLVRQVMELFDADVVGIRPQATEPDKTATPEPESDYDDQAEPPLDPDTQESDTDA